MVEKGRIFESEQEHQRLSSKRQALQEEQKETNHQPHQRAELSK